MLRAGRMRAVPSLIVLGMIAAAVRAQAAPLDAVVLPSGPLAADGERAHLLRLFVVDKQALATGVPSVRAARGAIVGAPVPASDGGVTLRYRPPRVAAPATDTLTVTLHGREARLPVALEPAGRVHLAIDVPPGA